jgi:hypothetical protein
MPRSMLPNADTVPGCEPEHHDLPSAFARTGNSVVRIDLKGSGKPRWILAQRRLFSSPAGRRT